MGRHIKNHLISLAVGIGALVLLGYITITKVYGYEIVKGHATAYTAKEGAITKSGSTVYEGGCAGSEKYLGKYVIIFQRLPNDDVGDLIGVYYCNDTGGSPGIKNGNVIDVYRSNLNRCQDFMDLVYQNDCKGNIWMVLYEKDEFF